MVDVGFNPRTLVDVGSTHGCRGRDTAARVVSRMLVSSTATDEWLLERTMVLRVGVLGLSHDHIWPNLKALAAGSVGKLVAVAEPDPALRARLSQEQAEQGAVETHESYDDL